MYNKNSTIKNDYLLSLDNIHKYTFKSIYQIPKFSRITLSFSLNNLIESSFLTQIKLDKRSEILSYFYLYILSSRIPYINSNNIKVTKSNTSISVLNYSLSISYVNKQDINTFLKFLFLEVGDFIKSSSINFKSDNCSFQLKVPVYFFTEINDLLVSLIPGINTKEFCINLNFSLDIHKNLNNDCKNIIRNLNFFG